MPEKQGKDDQWLANQIQSAATQYQSERDRDARVARHREIAKRSIRQFILFLIFFGLAAGFIHRNKVGGYLQKVNNTVFKKQEQAEKPQAPGNVDKAKATIRAASDSANERNKVLDELHR